MEQNMSNLDCTKLRFKSQITKGWFLVSQSGLMHFWFEMFLVLEEDLAAGMAAAAHRLWP